MKKTITKIRRLKYELKKISMPLIHLNTLDEDVPVVLTNDIDDAYKFGGEHPHYDKLIGIEGVKIMEVVVKKSIIIEKNHYKNKEVKV